jgi:hypothetical protein
MIHRTPRCSDRLREEDFTISSAPGHELRALRSDTPLLLASGNVTSSAKIPTGPSHRLGIKATEASARAGGLIAPVAMATDPAKACTPPGRSR